MNTIRIIKSKTEVKWTIKVNGKVVATAHNEYSIRRYAEMIMASFIAAKVLHEVEEK